MSVLNRFANVMSFNVKSVFNKSKNPQKEITEYLNSLALELGAIKSETNAIVENEHRLKRQLLELEDRINKYDRYANKSIEAGNSTDAHIYLEKKEKLLPSYNSIKQAYELAAQNSEKVQKMHEKIVNDIEQLKSRLNEINKGMKPDNKKFTEIEELANKAKYEAEAMKELNNLSNKDDSFEEDFNNFLTEEGIKK